MSGKKVTFETWTLAVIFWGLIAIFVIALWVQGLGYQERLDALCKQILEEPHHGFYEECGG